MTVEKAAILIYDNLQKLKMLAADLSSHGYCVSVAVSELEALEYLSRKPHDLVLIYLADCGADGLDICKRLKSDDCTRFIPVVVLSSKSDSESKSRCFELGAADYMAEPFDISELALRIEYHIKSKRERDELKALNEELERINSHLLEKNVHLEQELKKLQVLAVTDELTGLFNRRHIIIKIAEEIVRFNRGGSTFSFIMGDVDRFKYINDTYGHECGDEVLKQVSNRLSAACGDADILARWGGEEFLILQPDSDAQKAYDLAERLRREVCKLPTVYNGIDIPVTMTFGISQYHKHSTPEECIAEADFAMLDGKNKGGNQVVIHKKYQ